MFVIRLASGNLMVPEYALSDGNVIGDAYVEIGPEHADYARLADQAISEQQDADEALRREFLDYLARYGSNGGWNGDHN
jgi:hypothetical protein